MINQQKLQPFARVHERLKVWTEDVLDGLGDAVYDKRCDPVENQSRDGFIPYTSGGWDGIGYASMEYSYGTGSVPLAIQPYLNRELADIKTAWDAEHPETSYDVIFAPSLEDEGQETLPGIEASREADALREEYYEFEHNSLSEGGTYFFKARCLYYVAGDSRNTTGKDEVYLFTGINTDFEYGRDSIPWLGAGKSQQSEWVWERTVRVRDLSPRRIEALTRSAIKAWNKLY